MHTSHLAHLAHLAGRVARHPYGYAHAHAHLSTPSGWANSRCELSGPYVRVGIKSNTLKTSSDTIEHAHRALQCTGPRARPTPQPPPHTAESRKSQSGSHRKRQIHEKKRPASPPPRPTAWPPAPRRLKMSLGRAAPPAASIGAQPAGVCSKRVASVSGGFLRTGNAWAGVGVFGMMVEGSRRSRARQRTLCCCARLRRAVPAAPEKVTNPARGMWGLEVVTRGTQFRP